jgi:hypothetical protein
MNAIAPTQDKTRNPFYRLVSPGVTPRGRLFVEIDYREGRLSVVGVEGPMSNGDCRGSAGQTGIAADLEPNAEEGWDAGKVAKLRDIWEKWHLNDMRAACAHQRKDGWGEEKVEVVTYKLTHDGWELKRAAEKEALAAAREGRLSNLSDTGRALLGNDILLNRYSAPDADSPLSGLFEVEKRETKLAGWVRQDEHPQGVLSKPCPVCGYKYGSAWLKEEVPSSVLGFLRRLKDTGMHYNWTRKSA